MRVLLKEESKSPTKPRRTTMTKAQSAKMQAILTALGPDAAILLANLLAGLNPKAKPDHKKIKADAPLSSKEDRKLAFEMAAVAAFKKAGFADVVPNDSILTYSRWEAKGFKVRPGEKAIRVKAKGMKGKGIPLFHKAQVE